MSVSALTEGLLPLSAPATDGATSNSSTEPLTDFAALLQGKIESAEPSANILAPEAPASEEPDKPKSDTTLWEWFGFVVPIPNSPPDIPGNAAMVSHSAMPAQPVLPQELETSFFGRVPEPPPPPETPTNTGTIANEQILPVVKSGAEAGTEQTAGIQLKTAAELNGMFVAQRPAMAPVQPRTNEAESSDSSESLTLLEPATPTAVIEQADVDSGAHTNDSGESGEDKTDSVLRIETPGNSKMEVSETFARHNALTQAAPVGESTAINTIEQIQRQVEVLRTSSLDRLEVVVRPYGNTELFVQVTRVDGQLQVQIRCDRGDIAFLENNWSRIQQSLAGQGIKVEPLQHSFSSNDFSQSGSRDQQQRSSDHGAEIDRLGIFLDLNHEASQERSGGAQAAWHRWA